MDAVIYIFTGISAGFFLGAWWMATFARMPFGAPPDAGISRDEHDPYD